MERDDYIIHVYCLVCELYAEFIQRYRSRQGALRRGGFAPALSDPEVITIELCGEFFKLHNDQDLFNYFVDHYHAWFPALRDRVAFVRQAANLWQVKAWMQPRLVQRSGADQDPLQIIDTIPLPVCGLTRGPRDRCFRQEADYGYCAAKEMHYYGFKLGLRTARNGMIVHYALLDARSHDVKHLPTLVEDCTAPAPEYRLVAGDKAFWDPAEQALLEVRQGLNVVVAKRSNMKHINLDALPPRWLQRVCAYWRKRIETVGSQLSEHFALARIRVRDLWHLQHRLLRKVLAHTTAVFLNLQLRRPPLDLDDLLTHTPKGVTH